MIIIIIIIIIIIMCVSYDMTIAHQYNAVRRSAENYISAN